MSPEPPLDPAQRRREMAWFLVAVLTTAAVLLGARWWVTLLDYVEPVSATVTAVAVAGGLVMSRGRRGPGWNAVRLLCCATILLALAMAALVAACIPSACFN